MKATFLENRIAEIVRPALHGRGYDLVCVSMQGPVLQIMAENPQTRNLGVDECALLSREISTLLEVEDPIKGSYRLEVSSPGIDRPLVKLQDFADFAGHEARVEINPPHEGQKRFRGRLKGLENDAILLDTDMGLYALPFASIEKARLVLTDELLKKNKRGKND